MNAKAFLLILQVMTGDDQRIDEFVLDYGLTESDCMAALETAPTAQMQTFYGSRVVYSCELGDPLEDGDDE